MNSAASLGTWADRLYARTSAPVAPQTFFTSFA